MSDQPGWAAPDEGAPPPAGSAPPPPPGGYPPGSSQGSPPGYDAPPGYGVPPGYGAPPGYPPPPGGPWGAYGAPYGGSPYAAAPAAYAGYEVKPGVVPLRPLGIGETLDGALSALRSNWKVLLGSAALIVGAYALISFILDLTLLSDVSTSTTTFSDSTGTNVDFHFASLFGFLPSTLVELVALLALTAVCSSVVGRAVLGERPTWSQAWERTTPHLAKLLGVAVLAWLAILAGSLLCGVGAIYPWVVFSLSVPALVLERGGATASMGRSFALVKGAWWRTFGTLVLGLVIYLVISFAISLPLLIISGAATGLFSGTYSGGADVTTAAVSALAGFLAGVISWPFLGCLVAVIYVDRRMRTEGLDLELQRASGAVPQPAYPPAPPTYPPQYPPQYLPQYPPMPPAYPQPPQYPQPPPSTQPPTPPAQQPPTPSDPPPA